MKNWLKESNRDKHFAYAIPIGLFLTILTVIGVASGMEFKDKCHGGEWDWKDWWATILGGLIGQAFQLVILGIIFIW